MAAVVLGVTAVLVNAVPARQAVAQPFTYSVSTLGVQVNTIVSPAVAGPTNEIHVYVLCSAGTPPGRPGTRSVAQPAVRVDRAVDRAPDPGRSRVTTAAEHVDIPVAGSWVLNLTVRTDAIDEQVVTTTLPVR